MPWQEVWKLIFEYWLICENEECLIVSKNEASHFESQVTIFLTILLKYHFELIESDLCKSFWSLWHLAR